MSTTRRDQYLEQLGIDRWVPRRAADVPVAGVEPVTENMPEAAAAFEPPRAAPVAPAAAIAPGDDWERLRAEVAACEKCGLCTSRTQTVFGVGNPSARWLIVGEAPGAEEDRRGEPFVGRAGQLLNSMLRALGESRESVFIANILKCRPPNNRDPLPTEVAECLPYLQRQIAAIKPSIILAVGRIAAQNLLATNAPLARLRGRVHDFGESAIPLVVTYHPAYLLRSPAEKRKAWEDMKLARSSARREG